MARPRESMSILGFLRALRHGDAVAGEVLVTGLDRMLYQVYRLHGEGEVGRQAVRQAVKALDKALNDSQARRRLLKEAPVVVFALEYVEHADHWKAGVRLRKAVGDDPLELFWLEQFFPHCEVTEIGGESVCYSAF